MLCDAQMAKYIEKYKEIVNSHQEHAPIAKLIGLKMTSIKEGEAVFELEVKPEFLNSLGVMQGGVISILADAAMGISFGSVLDEGLTFSTLEFKINFFRPVTKGNLQGIGRVTNKGRKTGYTECEIFNDEGKLVAKSVCTCIVLQKRL